jgi:hypothetical protein
VQVFDEIELFKGELGDVLPPSNLLNVKMDVIENAACAQTELLHFFRLVDELRGLTNQEFP